MGDRLGTPGAVGILFFRFPILNCLYFPFPLYIQPLLFNKVAQIVTSCTNRLQTWSYGDTA